METPVKGVSHIQLRVTDVARSVEWYRTAIGLVRHGDGPMGGAVPLFAPNGRFAVVISDGRSGSGDVDHVAFAVADRASLAEWAEVLTAVGIDHGGLIESNDGVSIHLVDPDGLPVELIAP